MELFAVIFVFVIIFVAVVEEYIAPFVAKLFGIKTTKEKGDINMHTDLLNAEQLPGLSYEDCLRIEELKKNIKKED